MSETVYPRSSAETPDRRRELMEAIWAAAEMRPRGAFADVTVALAAMAEGEHSGRWTR